MYYNLYYTILQIFGFQIIFVLECIWSLIGCNTLWFTSASADISLLFIIMIAINVLEWNFGKTIGYVLIIFGLWGCNKLWYTSAPLSCYCYATFFFACMLLINGYMICTFITVASHYLLLLIYCLQEILHLSMTKHLATICIIFLINSINVGCIRDKEDNGFFRFRWGWNSSFAGLWIFIVPTQFFFAGEVLVGNLLVI